MTAIGLENRKEGQPVIVFEGGTGMDMGFTQAEFDPIFLSIAVKNSINKSHDPNSQLANIPVHILAGGRYDMPPGPMAEKNASL